MAGGAEDLESPSDAASGELCEELSLAGPVPVLQLDSRSSISAHFFDRSSWRSDTFVVPEFAFGAEVTARRVRLSDEHTEIRWLRYEAAYELLTWDSNRKALWELCQRLTMGEAQSYYPFESPRV